MPVWIQIRNIPVNHYTVPTITMLGDFIGEVKEVVLDPDRPQNQAFVRVKVIFDVSKPLRREKVVNFKGVPVTIRFDFERVQKRCFACQRLTHEQERCPIWLKSKEDLIKAAKGKGKGLATEKIKCIPESDPLFGVVEEDQIGINPNTGRPRIAKEVIDGMRQYLLVADGAERIAREARIKQSLLDLKNDPIGEKTMLRLETPHVVSNDLDKGKGVVFEYQNLSLLDKEERWKAAILNQGILCKRRIAYEMGTVGFG